MKIRLHLKIFVFIAIFIVTRQIGIYGILMLFALFHELGHMLAGILLGFKPNSLEIMPLGLSIGFESKLENYNRKIKKGTLLTLKKIIIAASGPITNLLFIIVFLLFPISFFGISRDIVIYANILIAIFNLIPIYPLDGGRIAKGILHILFGRKESYRYSYMISNVTISILTAISSIVILNLKNIAILLILAYLWYLVISENKRYKTKQKIYEKIKNIEKTDKATVS